MRQKICQFIAIYLTALTLSITFAHLLEMPRKMQYDQSLYVAMQHSLYLYFAWVGSIAEVSAVVFLIILCVLLRRNRRAFRLTLVATVCITAGLAVWFLLVNTANAEMAQWGNLPLPENWDDVRRQWEYGHAISAALDLIGFGALVASVVFPGR